MRKYILAFIFIAAFVNPSFASTRYNRTQRINQTVYGNLNVGGDVDITGSLNARDSVIVQTDKLIICSVFTAAGINACIDALGAEGGEVYLPEGTYDCNGSTITIDAANTTLTGSGKGTILDWSTSQAGFLDTNDKNFVTIKHIYFLGNSPGGDTNAFIGDGDNADNLTVENCWFYETDFLSIYTSGKYVMIKDCWFYDGDNGEIRIMDNYAQIEGNILHNCDGYPIEIESGDYGIVTGNTIMDTYTGYADIKVKDDYHIISNNIMHGNGTSDRGIHLDDADYCTVVGNYSIDHDVAGIQIDSDCQNCSVGFNNVYDSTAAYVNNGTSDINTIAGKLRAESSEWYFVEHVELASTDPGASGATWVGASTDTLGGFKLDAVGETLIFQGDIHDNWDEETDIELKIVYEVNADNSGGTSTDTVDIKAVIYYKGTGETSCKSQTVEEECVIGASPQYKQFVCTIMIDYDAVSNVIELGDKLSFIVNLETDTSEVDNIIVNHIHIRYKTKHVNIET